MQPLIKPQDVIRNTLVRNSVDTDIIEAAIKRQQQTELTFLLGSALVQKLESEIVSGTPDPDYIELLEVYVQPFFEWQVCNSLIYDLAVSMGQLGVIQNAGDQGSAIFEGLTAVLKNQIASTEANYKAILLKYLCYNSRKFPEYDKIESDKPNASKDGRPFNGIQFY